MTDETGDRTNTEHPLVVSQKTLLDESGLAMLDLEQAFGSLLIGSVDAADLYLQRSCSESWVLEEGIVKDGQFSLNQGVGVRAISQDKQGFAYSDAIRLPAMLDACRAARSIVRSGNSGRQQVLVAAEPKPLYAGIDPQDSLPTADKLALLTRVDAHARSLDSRVEQVTVSLSGSHDTMLVARSDGVLAGDVRPLVRFSVSVIVEAGGRRESASCGGGGRFSYQYFHEQNRALGYAEEAVRQALLKLDAVAAPAGSMPVVLGPGWPGVLLHEAVGHGLEGDFNRKGTSAFAERMGQQVASPLCTVVDDGTLPSRRGSLTVDDEGTPSQYTTLIDQGRLVGYMQDTLNARLMNMEATGNGRRQSYAHLPMPRMTNTYMLAGPHDPEEIIASVDKGLYAVNFGGGSVDITSGKFVFSASEAYLIEKGKVTRPVRGATLIGNGPEIMTRISMVGDDLELDQGVGTCGKEGQSVPVGVGQPTLKVDQLTVGGTQV